MVITYFGDEIGKNPKMFRIVIYDVILGPDGVESVSNTFVCPKFSIFRCFWTHRWKITPVSAVNNSEIASPMPKNNSFLEKVG